MRKRGSGGQALSCEGGQQGVGLLQSTNLAPLGLRLRCRDRFTRKDGIQGIAQVFRGGRPLTLGRAEVEVIDAAFVKRLPRGRQDDGLRGDGGFHQPSEGLVLVHEDGGLDLGHVGMLESDLDGDLAVRVDQVNGGPVCIVHRDGIDLRHERPRGGAEGRDEEQHDGLFLSGDKWRVRLAIRARQREGFGSREGERKKEKGGEKGEFHERCENGSPPGGLCQYRRHNRQLTLPRSCTMQNDPARFLL